MAIDYLVTDTELSDIADAIRAKGGTSASISFPNGFTTAIAAIPTGITPTGTKQITISGAGTVTEDVTNYASAEVTTPAGTAGTPTATKGAVSGHAVSVTPSVTNSAGWVSSETKNGTPVSVSAAELVSGTLGITQNGTGIDVANYASVDVNVSGGGSSPTVYTSDAENGTVAYTGPLSGIYDPSNGVFSRIQVDIDEVGVVDFVCIGGYDAVALGTLASTTFGAYDDSNGDLIYILFFSGGEELLLSEIIDVLTTESVQGALYSDLYVYTGGGGGGSVQTRQVTIPAVPGTPRLCYTDNTMTVNVIDGLSAGLTFEAPVGSIVTITSTASISFAPGESPVGVTQRASYVSGRNTYARIYSVDAAT